MKLVFLFGTGAVGKMTVGQALTKITPLRLFHNHMAIEPVLEVFGGFHGDAIKGIRDVIFREFAKTEHYGMIFTFMWAFDMQEDWDYIAHIREIFDLPEEDVYYVELVASQEVRLQRNETENRLQSKPSKRNTEFSRERILMEDSRYRLVSLPGEIPSKNYLRVDNTDLTPEQAAQKIKDHFQFA